MVLCLNTLGRVANRELHTQGMLNTSLVTSAEGSRGAIRRNWAAVVVAHNRLCGDPTPARGWPANHVRTVIHIGSAGQHRSAVVAVKDSGTINAMKIDYIST